MDLETLATTSPQQGTDYVRYSRIAQDMTPEDRRLFRTVMARFLGDPANRRLDGETFNSVALADKAFRDAEEK